MDPNPNSCGYVSLYGLEAPSVKTKSFAWWLTLVCFQPSGLSKLYSEQASTVALSICNQSISK